jgi:two-component sensor histidine kinase
MATVRLSKSDNSDNLKQLIEGRINAPARVNGLFARSRWEGADLRTVATQEVFPYCGETETRVRIDGPFIMLDPNMAKAIAMSLHELATNAAKYGSLLTVDGLVDVSWSRTPDGRLSLQAVRPSQRPRIAGSAHALSKA